MKTIVILNLVSLLFGSCIKEIELEHQNVEKKIVVNSLICPDSLVAVKVSTTTAILVSSTDFVDNANVNLFCDGTFIERLKYCGNGKYASVATYPVENKIYTIEVELDGYPTIRATDTVPEKTFITYGTHSEGNTFDEYGDPHQDYEVLINDKEKSNFYELFFIQQDFPNIYNDSYNISYQCEIVVADPVLRSDSELEYFVWTYIFSDSYFNGQNYLMVNKFLFTSISGTYEHAIAPTEKDHYAILRTTTSVYFNYRKYWLRHSNNQQIGIRVEDPLFMSLIGESVPMYSNVENGYGIFAAYNQSYYKLEEL